MGGLDCGDNRACKVVLNTVIPLLGVLTAIFVTVAPVKEVLRFRKRQALGNLNPTPYAFIFGNALIWIGYGQFVKDPFVVTPNLLGCVCGAWYTHSAYLYATQRQRWHLDVISLGLLFVVMMSTSVAVLALNYAAGRQLLGIVSIIILALFYSSPLTAFAHVVRTKNAAIFSLPLAAACLVNGALWTVYGVVLADWFIWGPNLLGAIVAIMQIVCRVVYGARIVESDAHEEGLTTRVPGMSPAPHADPEKGLLDGSSSYSGGSTSATRLRSRTFTKTADREHMPVLTTSPTPPLNAPPATATATARVGADAASIEPLSAPAAVVVPLVGDAAIAAVADAAAHDGGKGAGKA
ncbi:hypothetical protein AMAG_01492 [Allomyces macrogynus ATCC 38327]|uniref:Sugar transporter SWEET1 n=1 Tax=Allomyces macrogynus (strain ATCC 38327) TaxID=578462 RepID=A0A0L0RYX6_ALLM3|nr:hypothetical protein AMAG_01492 [Allomyces macrogynus ATCC 38327]|eukprot:KNE55602.1 hypothetical protein AMAG_01492 [Allomyces macrogynus ATCC 38327]